MPRQAKQKLHDRVAAIKRDAILDAARHVFAEKGFHRATIKDIAAQAGVADGTVYNHFENKDALLWALLQKLGESELEAARQAGMMDASTGAFFAPFIRDRLTQLDPDRLELLRVLISEMLVDDRLRAQYLEHILMPSNLLAERALQAATQGGHAPIDVALSSRITSATVFGLIVLRLLGDPVLEARWGDLAEALPRVLMSGLRGSA